MSVRGSVGLHASNVLLRSPYPVAFRLTHSLRPFSITTAKSKSPKIRTRFSGPQPNSAQETVTFTPTNQPAKKTRVSNPQPLGTQDSSVSDETGISFAETRPFPDQDLSSTRPVALQIPEAPKPQDHGGVIPITVRLSYLYSLGKSYITFYKTGLKNIWFNYKEYQKIKQRLGPFPLNEVVKYSGKDGRPTISRREYQLCLRTQHDIRKLIPFGLILLICGEFTPLVVLALGSAVVPSTCRIPRQVTKDHVNSVRRLRKLADVSFSDEEPSARSRAFLEARVGYLWGLMPSPRPLPLVHYLLRPRVRKYAEELVCDAILVRREGGVARLEGPELLLFMEGASRTSFDRLVKGELDDPLRIEQGQTRKRFALSFEEHIDETLQTLRELEDRPHEHYVAGLNY
jgi:hypothetical protein